MTTRPLPTSLAIATGLLQSLSRSGMPSRWRRSAPRMALCPGKMISPNSSAGLDHLQFRTRPSALCLELAYVHEITYVDGH